MVKIRMIRSGEGQMTLDFLFGLVIFLLAVLYLVSAIPGIFLPYQNNAVDLSSVVYRTSALLVEDPGYFVSPDNTAYGTQWERQSTGYLARVGLASDKSEPNVISEDKLLALGQLPYTTSRDKLGLNNSVSYDYNLTMTWINNSTGPSPVYTETINGITPNSENVETIQRSVLVDEGKRLLVDGSKNADSSQLVIYVNRSEITNGNSFSNVTLTVLNSKAGQIYNLILNSNLTLNYNQDYIVYINNTAIATPPVIPVPAGSRIDIKVNGSQLATKFLTDNSKTVTLTFGMGMNVFQSYLITPPYPYDSTNPLYWSIYDKATLILKVW